MLPGHPGSIDAGALDAVQLSYQERRIYHLHESIDRVIGAERVPRALRVAAGARRPRGGLSPMHPFVALMRKYCIDYTNSHDQSLYDEIMEPDYVVHINGFDLVRDRRPTRRRRRRRCSSATPGLGLVVHELVLNGDRLCMHFSEHAAMPGRRRPGAWRAGGASASTSGTARG